MVIVMRGKNVKISHIPKEQSPSKDLVDKMRAELHKLNDLEEDEEDED